MLESHGQQKEINVHRGKKKKTKQAARIRAAPSPVSRAEVSPSVRPLGQPGSHPRVYP